MIRMLVLEDDAAAAESSYRILKHAGIDCSFERVESEVEFRQALGRAPDVILSDSNVPGFDGLSALAIAQAQSPGTPFIFVTGSPDAPAAQEARERGAAGLVAKQDLERLAGVVCSVLDERKKATHEQRPDRRKTEADADASSTATHLIERQAILDRA
ncbi:MAG: response regulator, partial [Steroidobacteraceae bacterium]